MSEHLTFSPLSSSSPHLNTVVRWIYDEWSKANGDTQEEIRAKLFNNRRVPPSQVAVLKTKPVGFVWISRFQRAGDLKPTLWINGLYVSGSYRSRGIGTSLVKRAENLSSNFEDHLYAYTEIPEYYLRRGWHIHQEKDEKGSAVVCQKLGK